MRLGGGGGGTICDSILGGGGHKTLFLQILYNFKNIVGVGVGARAPPAPPTPRSLSLQSRTKLLSDSSDYMETVAFATVAIIRKAKKRTVAPFCSRL